MTHHWGYVGALASAILFGISSTLNKIALEDVDPLIVAGMIYFIGGVLLLAIHLSPIHRKLLRLFETPTETETTILAKDYRVLAFVILCGSVVAPFLLLHGLNETTAINASLLLSVRIKEALQSGVTPLIQWCYGSTLALQRLWLPILRFKS